jgi:2'-5' RNA ligase
MISDTYTKQFGIITLLPSEPASYAEALYDAVEQRYQLTGRSTIPWLPHVTLKYHFTAEDISPVEAALTEFSQIERPRPWSIDGFNSFHDGDIRVIFMEIVANPTIRAFHERLLSCLRQFDWMTWGPYDGPELHYHSTIAHRGLTPENFEEVWGFVNSRSTPRFDLLLDNLTLVEVKGDGERATVRQRFDLTGSMP